jgi:uncharacterized membrane protein YbhN (UPF0104 family)
MNNQLDEPAALHLPDLSCDPVEEALSRLEHLSKERRKQAALQLLSQLSPAERTDIAQKTGMFSVDHKTKDRIMSIIVITFVFIMVGSFLALVLFEGLGIKTDTNVLFSLINATAGFLVGLLVPTPGSSKAALH